MDANDEQLSDKTIKKQSAQEPKVGPRKLREKVSFHFRKEEETSINEDAASSEKVFQEKVGIEKTKDANEPRMRLEKYRFEVIICHADHQSGELAPIESQRTFFSSISIHSDVDELSWSRRKPEKTRHGPIFSQTDRKRPQADDQVDTLSPIESQRRFFSTVSIYKGVDESRESRRKPEKTRHEDIIIEEPKTQVESVSQLTLMPTKRDGQEKSKNRTDEDKDRFALVRSSDSANRTRTLALQRPKNRKTKVSTRWDAPSFGLSNRRTMIASRCPSGSKEANACRPFKGFRGTVLTCVKQTFLGSHCKCPNLAIKRIIEILSGVGILYNCKNQKALQLCEGKFHFPTNHH